MNAKDRIMAVIHGEEPDEVPLGIYNILMPRGAAERELRNNGVGLIDWVLVHKINVRGTKLVRTTNWAPWSILERFLPSGVQYDIEETYHTSLGKVTLKSKAGLNFVGGRWVFEPLIKSPSDYDVVEYLVENTEVLPDYDKFVETERLMGSDGIVYACGPKSPIQEMIMLMGYRNFAIHYFVHRTEFEDLYKVLFKKIVEEYQVISESPAELVWGGENLDGNVTNPKLFEKYNLPFYDRITHLLHKRSKFLATHFDGRLKCLSDLIGKADIDIIEAFCPPPMGDLPIKEAREAWGEKRVLMISFPASASVLGEEEVERQVIEILRDIAPGNRAEIQICEDIPVDLVYPTLRTIMNTIKRYGKYPISVI
jgi:hypothetical protein